MGKLTDLKVRNAKPGVYGDGAGLYLRVKPSGAKSWVLRVQFQGRRQDIGLGGYPADRSLTEAR
ncbi:MAG: Arm DNA-binding domain-containing protein, partial [Croceibacterium sp.]